MKENVSNILLTDVSLPFARRLSSFRVTYRNGLDNVATLAVARFDFINKLPLVSINGKRLNNAVVFSCTSDSVVFVTVKAFSSIAVYEGEAMENLRKFAYKDLNHSEQTK